MSRIVKVRTDYVPEPCRAYLTPGKVYEVEMDTEYGGTLIPDDGKPIYVCLRNSSHLDGHPWRILDAQNEEARR